MTQSEFLKTIRQYFWQNNFTEVEVSYLNRSLPLEPNLYAFETNWSHTSTKFYLPTSPEFALKSHLAQHKSDCFSISHCFRDLESSGPQHTPEFLMLEWYQVNKNLNDLKSSVQTFINLFLPEIHFTNFSLPKLLPDNEPDFNQYFLNTIEPSLPIDQAVFITGFPNFLAPLSEPDQRFELYINQIEIANACTENRDVEAIKSAFIAEDNYRNTHQLPAHPYSHDFITNCGQLPPTSGVGLGLDRLLAIINQSI